MDDSVPLESAQAKQDGEDLPLDGAEVLSRINLSLTNLDEQLRQSEVPSLAKVAALIQDHGADLATYLNSDSKGKLVPRFLIQLATELTREHELIRRECEQLTRNIDQMRKLFEREQSCAANTSRQNGADAKNGNCGRTADQTAPKPLQPGSMRS